MKRTIFAGLGLGVFLAGIALGPRSSRPTTGEALLQVRLRERGAGAVAGVLREAATGASAGFVTDGDGTRRVVNLPPGDYSLSIHGAEEERFRVEAGKTARVSVALRRSGRIRGTVTDRAGTPLEGTRVYLLDPDTRRIVLFEKSVVTDARGGYDLRGVEPGRYAVRFRHDRFRPADGPEFFIPAVGAEVRIDEALEVGSKLAGRVVDGRGNPVPGARVRVGNAGGAGRAMTDGAGEFTIYGLNDGPQHGSASKAGYGTARFRNVAPGTTDLVFHLTTPGSVSGRVEGDPAPGPLAVTLSLFDEGLRRDVPVETRHFTGSEFEVGDLAPGLYRVEVEADGFEALDRPEARVESGRGVEGVRVRLRRK